MPAVVNVAHVATLAVTLFEAALHGPVPEVLVALTLKVYAVQAVKPVNVNGEDAPDTVKPPGVDVAV